MVSVEGVGEVWLSVSWMGVVSLDGVWKEVREEGVGGVVELGGKGGE